MLKAGDLVGIIRETQDFTDSTGARHDGSESILQVRVSLCT